MKSKFDADKSIRFHWIVHDRPRSPMNASEYLCVLLCKETDISKERKRERETASSEQCPTYSDTHLLTMAPYSMSPVAPKTMIAVTPHSDKLLIVTNTEHDDYHPRRTIRIPKSIQECGNDDVGFLKSRRCQIVVRRAWRIDLSGWVRCVCSGFLLHVHSLAVPSHCNLMRIL